VLPTAGIVGKLFGTRYPGTLSGLTLLSHQIGGFFGAWLGGIAFTTQGNFHNAGQLRLDMGHRQRAGIGSGTLQSADFAICRLTKRISHGRRCNQKPLGTIEAN